MVLYEGVHGGNEAVRSGAAGLTATASSAHTVANDGQKNARRVFFYGEVVLVDGTFHTHVGFTAVLHMNHLRLNL
jgi:hypothetical protein